MAMESNQVNQGDQDTKPVGAGNENGFNADRKKQLRMGLIAGAIIIAIVVGAWRIYSAGHVSTDDAQVAGHIIVISPKAVGFIKHVLVKDNEEVQQGQLLAEIDDSDYVVRLAAAEAELAVARSAAQGASTQVGVTSQTTASQVEQADAGVSMARAGISTAQKDLEQTRAMQRAAEADVVAANSNLKKAQDDVARYRKLAAKEEIPRQLLESAENSEVAAQARLTSAIQNQQAAQAKVAWAEARIVQAQAQLTDAQARVNAAKTAPAQVSISQSQATTSEARVQQAEAAVEARKLELSYTKIYSPAHGRVSKKSVEVGQNVAIGQPLLSIVPLELKDVWVVANFKETQLKNVRPGQDVDIDVDTYSGKGFHGKVDSIAAGTGGVFSLLPPENATGNYVKVVQRIPVKILLTDQNQDVVLRPGMNVVVTIHTR